MPPALTWSARPHSAFAHESKVGDNLFHLRLEEDGADYLVRLHPFAVFEVDDVELATGELARSDDGPHGPQPFTYIQPLLILTNGCNLACSYCYAYQGSYGIPPSMMSIDVLERTVDYLRQTLTHRFAPTTEPGQVYEVGLICFGGEPLLALPLIRRAHLRLEEICQELSRTQPGDFRPLLTVNTNGYQVTDEALHFLESIRSTLELVVSYDGWLHDRERRTRAGQGSATPVLDNLFRLRDAGIDVAVTSCVLPTAVAEPERTLESLAGLFRQKIPVNLSFIRGPLETVRGRAAYPGAVQQTYEPTALDRFGELVAREILAGAPIYTRRYRRRLLEGGYRHRCGAGLFEFAVMPDGLVYPCHNFIADGLALGNILDPGFALNDQMPLVRSLACREVKDLTPCRDCVFQSTCMSSFDCPAHSLQDLGDLRAVDDRFCGFARKVQGAILTNFIQEATDA